MIIAHLAAGAGGPINITKIDAFLAGLGGTGVLLLGVISMFRAHGQGAHHKVMASALVGLAGLLFIGVGVAGMAPHLSAQLASMIFSG